MITPQRKLRNKLRKIAKKTTEKQKQYDVEENTQLGLFELPTEVIGFIFSFWDPVEIRKTAILINKELHAMLTNEADWEERIKQATPRIHEVLKDNIGLKTDYHPSWRSWFSIWPVTLGSSIGGPRERPCCACGGKDMVYSFYFRNHVPMAFCRTCEFKYIVSTSRLKEILQFRSREISNIKKYAYGEFPPEEPDREQGINYDTREVDNYLKIEFGDKEHDYRVQIRENRYEVASVQRFNKDLKLRKDLHDHLVQNGISEQRASHVSKHANIYMSNSTIDQERIFNELKNESLVNEKMRIDIISTWANHGVTDPTEIQIAQSLDGTRWLQRQAADLEQKLNNIEEEVTTLAERFAEHDAMEDEDDVDDEEMEDEPKRKEKQPIDEVEERDNEEFMQMINAELEKHKQVIDVELGRYQDIVDSDEESDVFDDEEVQVDTIKNPLDTYKIRREIDDDMEEIRSLRDYMSDAESIMKNRKIILEKLVASVVRKRKILREGILASIDASIKQLIKEPFSYVEKDGISVMKTSYDHLKEKGFDYFDLPVHSRRLAAGYQGEKMTKEDIELIIEKEKRLTKQLKKYGYDINFMDLPYRVEQYLMKRDTDLSEQQCVFKLLTSYSNIRSRPQSDLLRLVYNRLTYRQRADILQKIFKRMHKITDVNNATEENQVILEQLKIVGETNMALQKVNARGHATTWNGFISRFNSLQTKAMEALFESVRKNYQTEAIFHDVWIEEYLRPFPHEKKLKDIDKPIKLPDAPLKRKRGEYDEESAEESNDEDSDSEVDKITDTIAERVTKRTRVVGRFSK